MNPSLIQLLTDHPSEARRIVSVIKIKPGYRLTESQLDLADLVVPYRIKHGIHIPFGT